MVFVSLANMRCLIQDWDRAWHTYIFADERGGRPSFWNGQKHPNVFAASK